MIESRKRYFQALVEAFDGLVYVCSPENIIEYVNQRVNRKFGRDITGEFCFKAIHGLDEVCSWCGEQAVFQGEIAKWEKFDPGTSKWFSFIASPVYREDGTISKLTVCQDITDKKKSEEQLKESERKLKTLMANLPGIVYRCRPDKIFTMDFASNGCIDLLGYTAEEITGDGPHSYSKLVKSKDRNNLLDTVFSALEQKRPYSFIYRVQRSSGDEVWVWEQGRGVFDKRGTLLGLEGFISNVTAQKEAELDLREENTRLKASIRDRYKFGDIIGKSIAMQKVYESILKAAATDLNVVIYGESGTGKEMVAKTIHDISRRKQNPFITVNCGAIPENLVESAFFGHKKGGFTGATADKKGFLDISDGGTLFLDEIGEISLNIQVKLLRAIEGYGYVPVGGNDLRRSDFRIVAATNRDLEVLKNEKKMREDFFYRVHILPIKLPPLRERAEDIPLLIEHFLKLHHRQIEDHHHVSFSFLRATRHYDWPGNIRELQSALHRFVTFGEAGLVSRVSDNNVSAPSSQVDKAIMSSLSKEKGGLRVAMKKIEREIIMAALEKNQWHRGKTAEFLKLDRKTLYRKAIDIFDEKFRN